MQKVIDYEFSRNVHTLDGPRLCLPRIFPNGLPKSLLDVGCGNGTWLKNAQDLGVSDIQGVDGVNLKDEELLFPKKFFRQQDFSETWDLGRRFDAALCLEVAEHLDKSVARNIIQSLTTHTDFICFSAACPGQPGQHHVNCQWPEYWQELFNSFGYACSDKIRWEIWTETHVEPWYRQNMFIARRDPANAGKEDRIRAAWHPDMLAYVGKNGTTGSFWQHKEMIEHGELPVGWYLLAPFHAVFGKVKRRLAK